MASALALPTGSRQMRCDEFRQAEDLQRDHRADHQHAGDDRGDGPQPRAVAPRPIERPLLAGGRLGRNPGRRRRRLLARRGARGGRARRPAARPGAAVLRSSGGASCTQEKRQAAQRTFLPVGPIALSGTT